VVDGHFPMSFWPHPLVSSPEVGCTIAGLFSEFLKLSQAELDQLTLSEVERAAFHNSGKGIVSQMVDTTGPLNTALHSWGSVRIVHVDVEDLSVTRDCSRVCKGHWSMSLGKNHVQISGISPQKKWLRFVGFQWNKGGNPEPPQQLLMAGISQVASPSQAAWIFAHIRSHLGDMKYWGISVHKPRHILACVCMELFELRDKWCGGYMPVAMNLFRESIEELLSPDRLPVDDQETKDPTVEAGTH